ncbi:hypothetical protein [Fundidesulfovibrio soli]|uniref:hypothetical protein n=1 Tax=Fundidesulfovibrio soli TaxID=2922716 RepID=UPI001FAF1CC6|nr:hypothetical protein [Fundidesulfovibrio soli]
MGSSFQKVKAFVFPLVMAVSVCSASLAFAGDYSFKVHNRTSVAIKQVLVKESGGKWGAFDIGSGIGPGKKATLVWAAHTNSQDCDQWIKVVYADGSESQSTKFDFCEDDLVLEFD